MITGASSGIARELAIQLDRTKELALREAAN
jgi:short-subunit dehydrogenase